jgi:hypothetical protein
MHLLCCCATSVNMLSDACRQRTYARRRDASSTSAQVCVEIPQCIIRMRRLRLWRRWGALLRLGLPCIHPPVNCRAITSEVR